MRGSNVTNMTPGQVNDCQAESITRATSPRHSAHLPTSSKAPLFIAPLKLVIVTSWRHWPHQTFVSSTWRIFAGMASQRWRAKGMNAGSVSVFIVYYLEPFLIVTTGFPCYHLYDLTSLPVQANRCLNCPEFSRHRVASQETCVESRQYWFGSSSTGRDQAFSAFLFPRCQTTSETAPIS